MRHLYQSFTLQSDALQSAEHAGHALKNQMIFRRLKLRIYLQHILYIILQSVQNRQMLCQVGRLRMLILDMGQTPPLINIFIDGL